MSIETNLYALLGPLVSNRCFPDVAPFNTPRPYIIWQQIGGDVVSFTDDVAPDLENGLIQITAWGETRLQANSLIRQIRSTLCPAPQFQARPEGAFRAEHEPDLHLYGASQDFSIWSDF